MAEREGAFVPIPPGHIPMVMLTPAQYMALNNGIQRPSYGEYAVMNAIVHGVQDFAQAVLQGTVIDNRRAELPGIAAWTHLLADWAKRVSLDELQKGIRQKIHDDWQILLNVWKGGIGVGMGSSLMQWGSQFLNTQQLVYAYSTIPYQVSIIPRMRRYWMSQFTPAVPDASMAWILFRRGIIKDIDFAEYASYDGWDKIGIDFLKSVWKQIPNEHTAFRMMMRGAIDKAQKDQIYYANAWESEWNDKLDAIYQWLPNAREAYTLFRRGTLKEDEMNSLIQAQGFMPVWNTVLPRLWERIPMPRDAFTALMRGKIDKKDFAKWVESNEWQKGMDEFLYGIYTQLPNSRQAFTLYKRDVIDEAEMKSLFKADGFDEEWLPYISDLFMRIPHPRDAFNAFMRGKITRDDFTKYVEENEWAEGMDTFLYDIYQRLPSAHEAFYMWVKGLITWHKRNELYKANGYDEAYRDVLTANYYYIPTVYDLTRIADFVEVDAIWATKILTERGLRASDISKILKMLKVRPLRDEIRRQIAIWVKRYRYGWATATQLDDALQDYLENGFIQSTEKDFTIQEAELNYEDELMEEKIDIYSWYFKTAIISEEELLEDFLDLGIREEKANLMVELLKAQGYYGYY